MAILALCVPEVAIISSRKEPEKPRLNLGNSGHWTHDNGQAYLAWTDSVCDDILRAAGPSRFAESVLKPGKNDLKITFQFLNMSCLFDLSSPFKKKKKSWTAWFRLDSVMPPFIFLWCVMTFEWCIYNPITADEKKLHFIQTFCG